jgi:hypothetical protein
MNEFFCNLLFKIHIVESIYHFFLLVIVKRNMKISKCVDLVRF